MYNLQNYTMKREIPTITDDMYNRVLLYFQPLAELAEQRGYPAKRMDKKRMTKEVSSIFVVLALA